MNACNATAKNDSPLRAEVRSASITARHDAVSPAISLATAIAVIAAVAINLRPGIVSISPVLEHLRNEFHLTNTQASLLTAIPTLLMGLLAIPTPWLARRFGRNRVILVALAVLGLATLLRAISTSAFTLLLATAGVGAGIAVTGALIAGFVKAHQPDRVPLLMGLYAASLGLGSAIAAAATGPVSTLTGSWRIATAIWVVPCLATIIIWSYVARTESAVKLPTRVASQHIHPHPGRSRTAWLVAMYFAANNFLFFGMLGWFVSMRLEFGSSPKTADLLLAGFTTVFMFSNPLPALISKGTDRRQVIGLFAAAFLVGIFLMIASPYSISWLPVALMALGIGGSFSLGMTLPLDNAKDADQANSWTSFTLAIGYSIGALGPVSVGLVRDLTKSFVPTLWLLAAAGALMLAITPFLKPRCRHKFT